MTSFEKWDRKFRDNNLYAFNGDANGLLWLKVRSVCRSKQLARFLSEYNLRLRSTKLKEQNVELFHLLEGIPGAMEMLDGFMRVRSNEWYESMGIDEDKLREDLYKVRYYDWGGDRSNSLDKHLVSRYVKTVSDYDRLVDCRAEMFENTWNYVQNSWYNNWTSYLIESLFKRHPRVVSAVGEIKGVDFFIDDVPIDLKVTYFPAQYMAMKLAHILGNTELTWLRRQARARGITADSTTTGAQLLYVLTEKLREQGHIDILAELDACRRKVIEEARHNSVELMEWLYSNQGEMRFGAENRLFLILIDSLDMSQSWKMKRAFSLIAPNVNAYIDGFGKDTLKDIVFVYNKTWHRSQADVLWVIK